MEKADPELYTQLLEVVRAGLEKVREHRDYFSRNALICPNLAEPKQKSNILKGIHNLRKYFIF